PEGGEAEPASVGFAFGLRAGYSLPFGSAKDSSLHGIIAGAVPLAVDVGYFLTPRLYLGGYVAYGFAFVGDAATDCNDPRFSCSASLVRGGIDARWHFRPEATIDPWAGAGLAYESVSLSETDADGTTAASGNLHGL